MHHEGAGRSRGLMLAAATAVISGFAVFMNGYGVRAWAEVADATTYTTFKNLVAAAVLAAIALTVGASRARSPVAQPRRPLHWLGLAGVAIVGGSIPFALFFEGFSRASSGQAAFIHKTLLVWVAVMAVVFLRERIGWMHVAAVGLLLWGQAVLLGGVADLSFGTGERLMLAATLLWSVEVVVAKRLLSSIPALTLGVARMAGGAALLVGYGLVRGAFADIGAIGASHLGWVLVTGLVLAGYVGTWYAALARAPAVDVTAILVGGALITAYLNVGVRGLAVPPAAGVALVGGGVAVAAIAAWRHRATGLQ